MNFGDTPTPFLVLWSLWMAQAAWACWNVWAFAARSVRLEARALRRDTLKGPYTPRCIVIVPVKGAGDHFESHALALGRQDYPDYRLVFVVESEQDGAFAALNDMRDRLGRPAEILVAGRAQHGGQKVHNQLHALATLRTSDEVVVFADADAIPHNRWLRDLVQPLRRESVGASTGYRWLVPAESERGSKTPEQVGMWSPSCFASVINGSVASLLGPPRRNHAWGGSMALTREMVERTELVEHWTGALSDDYQLTRAVKQHARMEVQFVPTCLVVSPVRYSWRSLFEFGRRQYIITRVHKPLLWLMALSFVLLYTCGWISALVAAALGWYWGLVAWSVVFMLDHLRASLRRRAVVQLLGKEVALRLTPVWRLERWGTPAWMGFHLLLILSSGLTRRINWAGIAYELRSRQDVRILRRD